MNQPFLFDPHEEWKPVADQQPTNSTSLSEQNRNEVFASRRDIATRDREVIFRMIDESTDGLTIDEAATILGVSPNQISGRFTELSKGPLSRIFATGNKRPTRLGSPATVWKSFQRRNT